MHKFFTLSRKKMIMRITPLFFSVLLSGCANDGALSFFSKSKSADYASYSCDDIWQLHNERALENLLYWSQLIECSKKLSSSAANSRMNTIKGADWPVYFKRSILLSRINGSDSEQRKMLNKLNASKSNLSESLQGFIGLWIKNQQIQAAFNAERNRYQRLKESADTQIKTLTTELNSIQIKLKSLTEIERQLPSRKATKSRDAQVSHTAAGIAKDNVSEATLQAEPIAGTQPKEEENSNPTTIMNKSGS